MVKMTQMMEVSAIVLKRKERLIQWLVRKDSLEIVNLGRVLQMGGVKRKEELSKSDLICMFLKI